MNKGPIKVSKLIDTTPRLFNLPASIVLPVLFVSSASMLILWIIRAGVAGIITGTFVVNVAYFFLFGQNWWRLASKFHKPPRWIIGGVRAIPPTREKRNKRTR